MFFDLQNLKKVITVNKGADDTDLRPERNVMR